MARAVTAASRRLSTAQTMLASLGPMKSRLLSRGVSAADADAQVRAWHAWDEAHGLKWRVWYLHPTSTDLVAIAKLAGEQPGGRANLLELRKRLDEFLDRLPELTSPPAPEDPPGFDEAA